MKIDRVGIGLKSDLNFFALIFVVVVVVVDADDVVVVGIELGGVLTGVDTRIDGVKPVAETNEKIVKKSYRELFFSHLNQASGHLDSRVVFALNF